MLRRLRIENIALISSATLEFEEGFCVFTGETGAGKSLVIDSLSLVLGARADRTLITYGKQSATVEAVFEQLSEETCTKLYEFGFEEEDSLILFRRIFEDGRNDCRVNGRSVTVGMLKELASTLVDVYGQFENQTMFKASTQLSLIDSICANKKDILELNEILDKIAEIDKQLEELVGDEKERERLLDMLAFQIDEIEEASFQEGEEEKLKDAHNKIVSKEKVLNSLASTLALLDNASGENVVDNIKQSAQELSPASMVEPEIEKLKERITDLGFEISDIVDDLHSWVDEYQESEENIDQIEERLDLLNNFKKKYGKTISDIWQFCEDAKERFDKLKNNKEETVKLKEKRASLEAAAEEVAEKLHRARTICAEKFATDIAGELSELGMKSAKFELEITPTATITRTGKDNITFMFSANAGIPVKPLSKVASGGELSRFMLALKQVLGMHGHIGTMVFDEIDTGISGQIGRVVGEKMYQISRKAQVLCISHLPQIACLADSNYLIEKNDDGTQTKTNIKLLEDNEKIDEVARLVGGFGEGTHARLHATEMIQNANYFKRSLS